ncbi:hypothetical protein [Aggregatilinea lenta]|uniref:hypothetical protein n=1 Tax=Aggregatilinea lenta TaxID=913108 RepID=UPI000E5B4C16|nr:hypothetical protein [Aggregatilinea lenta]
MTLTEIVEQAKGLSRQEQKELIKLLIDALVLPETPKTAPQKSHRLSELRGLGADIWQGVDVGTYIDELRDGWGEHS